ncbi:aminotransferase class I/II-fold pyridoxal phosphate-dependent enzyme [Mobilitalea sibirica]|uniref:Aminotransferase class I/II-fold pyridoxal phosphate-dependent enzyme n=1 Tax=Mobilitalea sibirica TaxID=1462919 RepID=A0A8J7HDM1_9FIRM|nr:aminotransferase class I/II-fold pyridoxal phosphate-dependent enzyme [Mobilitalea sibirica]MBH1940924.1 aminotransferase class I/II-fold pyridoxal phosphate-dependent enzyme [Mobilitalea sibirica]
MNIEFSERSNRFGSNIFHTLNDLKNERLKEGKPVYNFTVGTPDFHPDAHVMEAVSKAALEPENYKYSLGDTEELIDAVINWYQRRYQVTLSKDEITSVSGTQEGMAHIGLALINYGDTVLVPNPGYPIFEIGPYLCGAKIAYYNLLPENNYLPDLSSISKEVANKAKMMVVSYPSNPVCTTAPSSFYEELIAFAKHHQLVIIHDNAYSEIIYDGRKGTSFLSYPGAKDVGVEFNSLSKTYNITGIRISFLLGNKEIIHKFKTLRSQFDYGTGHLVQKAAIAALNGPQDSVTINCKEYEKRRDALSNGLTKLGMKVQNCEGSMFVWAHIPEGYTNSNEYCMKLFHETGILCTPGSSFGTLGEGYIRFALVLPVDVINAIFN